MRVSPLFESPICGRGRADSSALGGCRLGAVLVVVILGACGTTGGEGAAAGSADAAVDIAGVDLELDAAGPATDLDGGMQPGTIGAAGGTLTLPGSQGTVQVPAGAVATPTALLVEVAEGVAAPPFAVVSPVFDFGPDGLAFDVPVKVILTFDPGALPAGTSPSAVAIHWSSDGVSWQALPSEVDVASRRVSAHVSHFSFGAAGVSLCGDATCAAGETCDACPADCGACPCMDLGCPCEDSSDCNELCVEVSGGAICSTTCADTCPAGYQCQSHPTGADLTYYCLPTDCVATEEVCDGLDNDCNGLADDLSAPCIVVNQYGQCSGTQKCHPSGGLICDAQTPLPETCDGLDNDCDGDVDEDLAGTGGGASPCDPVCGDGACVEGETCESCSDDCGVCPCTTFGCPCEEPSDCNSGLCIGTETGDICTEPCIETCPEGFECKPAPTSGADLIYVCLPACVAAEEVCDGLDNDCNGVADDLVGSCTVENEYGQCSGTLKCHPSAGVTCDAQSPLPEICDGTDNDCDGDVDEGYPDSDGDGIADCIDLD